MIEKRKLDGDEDLVAWDVLTNTEQAQVFSLFFGILMLGVVLGAGLAKAGAI